MRGTIHLLTVDDAQRCGSGRARPGPRAKGSRTPGGDPSRHRRGERRGLRRRSADGPLPMKALGEALGERFPGVPPNALATWPGPTAAGPATAARRVEAVAAAWLPVRRPLARAAAQRTRPGGRSCAATWRAYGPASDRRRRLVGATRLAALLKADGRPGRARGRGRQGAVRRARTARSPTRTPPRRCDSRRLRQRLALPRRPRPGHRPREAGQLDGRSTAASP